MEPDLRQSVAASPARTLAALSDAAEIWSAAWEAGSDGGRLHLPVLAGIRRGRVLARVEVVGEVVGGPESRGAGDDVGSEIRLYIEESEYEVNRPAAVFLVLGALGGLVTVIWPLFPERMINFLPLAVVFLLGSWLLVASRLRTAGPRDFLETAAEIAEELVTID